MDCTTVPSQLQVMPAVKNCEDSVSCNSGIMHRPMGHQGSLPATSGAAEDYKSDGLQMDSLCECSTCACYD